MSVDMHTRWWWWIFAYDDLDGTCRRPSGGCVDAGPEVCETGETVMTSWG